jgi:hypothetical protein
MCEAVRLPRGVAGAARPVFRWPPIPQVDTARLASHLEADTMAMHPLRPAVAVVSQERVGG